MEESPRDAAGEQASFPLIESLLTLLQSPVRLKSLNSTVTSVITGKCI